MNNACTSIVGDIGIRHNLESSGLSIFLEVGEQWLVALANKRGTLELFKDLEPLLTFSAFRFLALALLLLLLRNCSRNRRKSAFCYNVNFPRLRVLHLQVIEFWVHAKGEVTGQGPGGRGPRDNSCSIFFTNKRKVYDNSGVLHVLVVQTNFEIRQRRRTSSRVWHDFETFVYQIFLEELLEDPPHTFHKRRVEGLVVVLEVNPPAQPHNGVFPLLRIPHNNASALLVVRAYAKLEDVVLALYAELLIYLVLDRKAVAVPAETSRHVVALAACVTGDDVLDSAGKDMSVVR
mmetsp:Transcript_8919/g.16577  ORF Transcript_8919/g.16577 Transcript_8919/m.16577 type:complete len:291 (-) Transcript_8919:137-1009(-)